MSFLRKWGSGPAPANGMAAPDAAKREWHTETPGERYFGMENVSRWAPLGSCTGASADLTLVLHSLAIPGESASAGRACARQDSGRVHRWGRGRGDAAGRDQVR